MGRGKKEKGSERITGKARRGREHWRGEDWNRSSEEWGECLRIGRAIRSYQGPMTLHLQTPILQANCTIEHHSLLTLTSPTNILRLDPHCKGMTTVWVGGAERRWSSKEEKTKRKPLPTFQYFTVQHCNI